MRWMSKATRVAVSKIPEVLRGEGAGIGELPGVVACVGRSEAGNSLGTQGGIKHCIRDTNELGSPGVCVLRVAVPAL